MGGDIFSEAERRRLKMVLEQRHGTVLINTDSAVMRRGILSWLVEDWGTLRLAVVSLGVRDPLPPILEAAQDADVLVGAGEELLLPAMRPAWLRALNRSRQALSSLPAALLLLLDPEAMDSLAQGAPEFWRWQQAVLRGEVSEQRRWPSTMPQLGKRRIPIRLREGAPPVPPWIGASVVPSKPVLSVSTLPAPVLPAVPAAPAGDLPSPPSVPPLAQDVADSARPDLHKPIVQRREIRGPTATLALPAPGDYPAQTQLVFHPSYRDHRTLTTAVDVIEPWLREPMVSGLVPLASRDAASGRFSYPIRNCVALVEVIRAGWEVGQHAGTRAGLELMRDAGKILEEAAEYGSREGAFSHGSLSPWRLLLKVGRPVRIIGYGLPQVDIHAHHDDPSVGMSADSMCYCPPERLLRQEEDLSSDLFSLTLCAIELMLGRPLYDGLVSEIQQMATRGETRQRLYQYQDHIPPHVMELLVTALRPRKASRFPCGDAFVQAVQRVLTHAKGPSLEDIVAQLSPSDGQTSPISRGRVAHAPPRAAAAPALRSAPAAAVPHPRRSATRRRRAPTGQPSVAAPPKRGAGDPGALLPHHRSQSTNPLTRIHRNMPRGNEVLSLPPEHQAIVSEVVATVRSRAGGVLSLCGARGVGMTAVMAQLERQLAAVGVPAQRYSAHALELSRIPALLAQPGAVLVDDVDREGHETVAQALIEGAASHEGWLIVEGVWDATTHILAPLSEDSALTVLQQLGLSEDRLSPAAARRIVKMAGGLLGTLLAIVRASLTAAITEQQVTIDLPAAEAGIAAVCQHRAQGLRSEHRNDLLELFDASAWIESGDLLQWVRRGWVIPTASEFVPHPMLNVILRAL